LNELARASTKFLQTQLDIARQVITPDGIIDDNRVRLRAQEKTEEISSRDLEKHFLIPEGFLAPPSSLLDQIDSTEADEQEIILLPTISDISRSIRSTTQCALYFQSLQTPPCSLLVFDDPSFAPSPLIHTTSSLPAMDFRHLSLGNSILTAQQFIPSLKITRVSEAEVLAAREWTKTLAGVAKDKSSRGNEVRNNRATK
jgi:hypothetical protein